MSLVSRENSRKDGRPVHLYLFRHQGGVLGFTNVARAMTFGANPITGEPMVYNPLPIEHSEIVASGNADKSALQITAPETGNLAELFGDESLSSVLTLVIRQGHVGDGDFKVCWAGRITGSGFTGPTLNLEGEPISTSLQRTGLTRTYSIPCPLVLFGSRCRASKAAATREVPVLGVAGPLVTLPADWAAPDRKDKFVGGMAEWTTATGRLVRRSIVRRQIDADVLVLGSNADGLVVGATIAVVMGCNHQMDDCEYVHDNILNFGGQPEIPLENPIGIVNNFY